MTAPRIPTPTFDVQCSPSSFVVQCRPCIDRITPRVVLRTALSSCPRCRNLLWPFWLRRWKPLCSKDQGDLFVCVKVEIYCVLNPRCPFSVKAENHSVLFVWTWKLSYRFLLITKTKAFSLHNAKIHSVFLLIIRKTSVLFSDNSFFKILFYITLKTTVLFSLADETRLREKPPLSFSLLYWNRFVLLLSVLKITVSFLW